MYSYKHKIAYYQDNQKFLLHSYSTKDDFLKRYNKLYNEEEKSKQLYLQILCELKVAICEGNITNFKKISNILNYLIDIANAEEFTYLNEDIYPLKNTNFIILACKYNQLEILKHIFSNLSLYEHFRKTESKINILPTTEDENSHNAFYYSIRAGNTKLLETLISKWPGNYFESHATELDEILSKAYEELKLKKVMISQQMEFYVEEKLIDLRFFSASANKSENNKISLNNINKRIELVIIQIHSLNSINEVNEEFLLILKYVALNIFTLKRQLKVFYNTLPWEEIEFTIVCFISCNTTDTEINLFYRVALNQDKFLRHLTTFAKRLGALQNVIKTYKESKLSVLPNISRVQCIAQIVEKYPEFTELYQDYHKIRDIHTLNVINSYVAIVSSSEVDTKEGQLAIIRSLQAIGECLKNTLESPKLSTCTSNLLFLSLQKSTRNIVVNLRNSLSHAYSLFQRTEILENEPVAFFDGVKNDIKKIGTIIKDIFYENNLKTIKSIFESIVSCENFDELKQIVSMVNSFNIKSICGSLFLKNDILAEHEQLNDIIMKLKNIPDQTEIEKVILQKMEKVSLQNVKFSTILEDYGLLIIHLTNLKLYMDTLSVDNNCLRSKKYLCKTSLDNLNSKEFKPKNLENLRQLSSNLLKSCHLKKNCDERDETIRLIMKIFCIIDIQLGNIHWVSKLSDKLNGHSYYNDKCYTIKNLKTIQDKSNKQLTSKLFELKKMISKYNWRKSPINVANFRDKHQVLAALEMLILEILSILDDFFNRLDKNYVFLDENVPLLIGKNLRNHLAHGNAILDIVPSDPLVGLIVTAKKFADVLDKSENKIGKLVIEDLEKLKNKIDLEKKIIFIKQKMFSALESGDFENLNSYIVQGADVHATKNDKSTSLHAAAKGGNLHLVKFLIEQKIDIQATSNDGKSPLHIAAKYGNVSIVEFFLKQKYYPVECKDNSLKTPLHLAALNSRKDNIETLLRYNASPSANDVLGLSPVHYAIQENHIDAAQILLKKEKHVDANETKGGFTCLHLASERGHLELVKFLLDHGANVHAKTDGQTIPLHLASLNGHIDVVNLLVTKKSNPNAKVCDGCTPLHYAVENGHKEIVDILLNHGADPNVSDKTYGYTPLQYAAKDGHIDIVQALIRCKANINAVDVNNQTPLFYAITSGHTDIVQALIRCKANINAVDVNNETPLFYAIASGHLQIVKIICQYENAIKNLPFSLHVATLHGHVKILDYLIGLKIDVNIVDNNGNTALHLAAFTGKKDIINLLLKNKAKINVTNHQGFSPLLFAVNSLNRRDIEHTNIPMCFRDMTDIEDNYLTYNKSINFSITNNEKYEVVDILLQNGANINVTTPSGLTVLHFAARSGNCLIVELLMRWNIPIDSECNFGSTPLQQAVVFGCKEIVEFLLKNGADVNFNSKGRFTALYLACLNGSCDIVNILLANNANVNQFQKLPLLHLAVLRCSENIIETLLVNGADVNLRNEENLTPLHTAILAEREKIVKILLEKGANIDCKISDGSTLLHAATFKGNSEIVEILLQYGIDVNAKDNKNRTAVELAVADGYLPIVKMLLPRVEMHINSKVNYDDLTLLHIAAEYNHVKVVEYLVTNGADINGRNKFGSKPIHLAAREGHEEIVKYFLSLGQDVEELGVSNTSLLHYCAMYGRLELAQFLIRKGANVNARSLHNRTPLHSAVVSPSKLDFIELLLEHGAMYNTIDVFGLTPISISNDVLTTNFLGSIDKIWQAVKKNNVMEVKRCINEGAFINARNSDNVTPLHFASWKGYNDIVEELVSDKDIANVIGKRGLSPLHYAAKFGHFNVCKTLLSAGAIYCIQGENGKTPLDLSENKDVSNLLSFIHSCFEMVSNKNLKLIDTIKKIKDVTMVKATMKACNIDKKSLIAAAIVNDFPKVEQLKQILQDDVSRQIGVADIMLAHEKWDEALKIYEVVLKKRTELLGKNNPGTLDIQDKIAKVLYKQQKYALAFNILQDIHEKQKDLFGENSKESLNTRSSMALILHRQGKNEEALAIFQQVYEKQKNILSVNDYDFLNTQIHMGLVLNALSKFDEALIMNTKVFEQRKKHLGSKDPATLVAQNNVAMVLTNQGKYEQAEKMYRQVYEVRKRHLGATHSDTLRAFHNIVTVLSCQEKYNDAMKNYEEVLKVQKNYLGSDHLDTLNTQLSMGKLLLKQGKSISAFKIFNSCLPAFKNKVGPSHQEVLNIEFTMEGIMKVLKASGKSDLINIINNINVEARAAVSSGDLKNVKRMLESDIDVNEADEDGRTLLHFAADSGNIEVTNILLNSGCILIKTSKKGNTPLHTATSKGHVKIVEEFLKYVNRSELPNFINAKTAVSGSTALHVAAKRGDYEIVQILLKYGAMYNPKNTEGKTPLGLSKSQRIVNLLSLIDSCFKDVTKGDREVIRKLCEIEKDDFLAIANAHNDQNMPLTLVAIVQNHRQISKDLLMMMKKVI